MGPVVLASARKHGIEDDDMLHAYRNPIRTFNVEGLLMVIGPDFSGRLLEVGIAGGGGNHFIVHAMPIRPRYTRLL